MDYKLDKTKCIATFRSPDELIGKYWTSYYSINDYKDFLLFKSSPVDLPTVNDDLFINTSRVIYYIVYKMDQLLKNDKKRSVNDIKATRKPKSHKLNLFIGHLIPDDKLWFYIKYARELIEDRLEMSISVKTLEYMIQCIEQFDLTYEEMIMVSKMKLKQLLNK